MNHRRLEHPHILLINPWIHDFAAYDFWAKPYGLLSLAAVIRHHGLQVSYIDCLDRFHPRQPPSDPHARHGRGPYRKRTIAHPRGLENIERTYSRYGIEPDWFREDLAALARPDLILITSSMTYWYPGLFETIRVTKEIFPEVPLLLGGVYARLCAGHAVAYSGADEVITNRGETLFGLIERYCGYKVTPVFDPADWTGWPYPALDLQHQIAYVPLLTTRGCPFACSYCAAHYLEPLLARRTPGMVVDEIVYWHRHFQAVDFAFYDDALLTDAQNHALLMFEALAKQRLPIRLHTPNAIHIRAVTARVADLMMAAGFQTLRLGLETMAFDMRSGLDDKVTRKEFFRAVDHLRRAGFGPDQVGAYLLAGLPGQSIRQVEASIRMVKEAGITPVLAHFTPIPHTRLWEKAVAESRYDLKKDPIFTNNAIFPCQREAFSWPALSRLKKLAAA